MNIADLRKSAADEKAEKGAAKKGGISIVGGGGPPTIHLQDDHLDKMGIDEMPEVGQHMEMHGRGKVVHSSESVDGDGKSRRSVHIEVHGLGLSKRKGEDENSKSEDGDLKSDLRKAAGGKEKTGPNISEKR